MSQITLEEVSKHNKESDSWIVVDGKVYDMTPWTSGSKSENLTMSEHPGGKKVLSKVSGTDASKQFHKFHSPSVLEQHGKQFQVGSIVTEKKETKKSSKKGGRTFGQLIPYGDPTWYQNWHSPYYNESHYAFRAAVRDFVDKELAPNADAWEMSKTFPIKEIAQKAYAAGILGGLAGAPWPTKYAGDKIAGGIKPEQFDAFHLLILLDELCRTGSYAASIGWHAGLDIGLPPVIVFGSEQLKDKIVGPCIRGEKVICLAITEPGAGSDVAQIATEARKTPDGKHYIVNGEKKWITNGIYADYFTTAVRTGGPGRGGISLLVIERGPGVTTRQMSCTGLTASGTTFVSFENVLVPVENVLLKENEGFKCIMYNFNHERMGCNISANRFARVCYEEAFKYALKRETFGKKLIEHAVIREKLAHMLRMIESTQALIEHVTFQLTKMSHDEAAFYLGGITAIMKSQATQTFEFCSREAAQIFGGLSFTKGGQGAKVERLWREARVYTIFAGSEEIMLDLGVRQAVRQSQFSKM
eukprot:TRINITY_DN446_c0_g2_i6.p1 TRINITY_DN446_c0_g2~~TRINITY_DN446_c0_g2_i6.p1  ORF type:complete len:529 (+),score=122.42 TRINITY_DN446_c0_g2_i6:1-1587(+)